MNLNKVFVLGRLTSKPELRTTTSGTSVTNFSVATNREWSDKNGNKQEEVEFHNVVVWGRTAEVAAQFLSKGSLVLVEGRLRTRSYEDKDGLTRKITEIFADSIQLPPKAPSLAPKPAVDVYQAQVAEAKDDMQVYLDDEEKHSFSEMPF